MFSLFSPEGDLKKRKFHIQRFSEDLYYIEVQQLHNGFWAGTMKSKLEMFSMNFSDSYIITQGEIEEDLLKVIYDAQSI